MSNDIALDKGLIKDLDISLERDLFMRTLIRELATVLEDVVGMEQAEGYISVVGQNMGDQLNAEYCRAMSVSSLTREQVADVLVDLKHRIQGNFYIIEFSEDKIILGSKSCPFAEKVLGKEAMCMMTSNVFGRISAQNLGYAKVELQETIARGDHECRVVVYLNPEGESENAEGREYFEKETDAT